MIKRSKVTEQPAVEPVTLDELKAWLRITDTSQDSLLSSLITSARIIAENYTGRKFIDQELTMYCDAVTSCNMAWWSGTREGSQASYFGNRYIELDWLPVSAITSWSYFDDSNDESVYSSSNYFLDNSSNDIYSRIVLNIGACYPANTRAVNAYKIVYRAGYGDEAADVPQNIKDAILRIASWMYANNGDCSDGSCIYDCGASAPLNCSRKP